MVAGNDAHVGKADTLEGLAAGLAERLTVTDTP
jgi:hypothetical protein